MPEEEAPCCAPCWLQDWVARVRGVLASTRPWPCLRTERLSVPRGTGLPRGHGSLAHSGICIWRSPSESRHSLSRLSAAGSAPLVAAERGADGGMRNKVSSAGEKHTQAQAQADAQAEAQ